MDKVKDFLIYITCFVFVVYTVLINDVYEYVDMHNLSHKNDYLRFAFVISICYFVGFSLICHFHSAKPIFLGVIIIVIAEYNVSVFKNGWLTPSYEKISNIDFVLQTTRSAVCRKTEFVKRWGKMPYPLHIYYGLEGNNYFERAKDYPILYEFLVNRTGLYQQRNNKTFSLALAFRKGLLNNFTLPNPAKEWIFVFEDDAVLNPRFRQLVQPALHYYRGYDLIWGDVITHADFVYKNNFRDTVSGMIYNQKSMEKIARMFDFDGPEFKELIENWPYGNTPPYVTDGVIAYNCNKGHLKCGYAPLTHEANDLSSSIGKIAFKY